MPVMTNDPSSGPELSVIGTRLTAQSGILELMDDLGRAMTTEPGMRMLGGGNPASVPEMQKLIRVRMQELLAEGDRFERLVGNYEPPCGNPRFIEALARLFRKELGWDVAPQNIAITSGGQSACFYLFNMLAGRFANGKPRKILLPLAPEYIGYADQGLEPDLFFSCRARIEFPQGPGGHVFKYAIDFDAVEHALNTQKIGAIAVSRPTNPTGNVLTDTEVGQLSALACDHGIPLMIDSAYGAPFPGILFVDAKPYWAPHVILTFSLSKLGMPGTRTGIVLAPEKIASAISSHTAILGLANGTLGQQLALPWVEDGSLLGFGPKILRPFYESKSRAALECARSAFEKVGVSKWAIHASEGAFFHWLWLPGLRISTRELYQRLKARRVLTVPSEYFFYGLPEDWPHRHECLRLNFSQGAEVVAEALQIIAEEAASAQPR